ncbi:acyltransferase family protein [Ichthyenterobacterium magnum]|uniref:Peptidoglycan/LPS O-acetylase OafA/YrhL n=1 Tax=Ichthyenterobacterium magnum TaxID=1230530 RepID=A0A420DKP3_9FLAO|nr:acyltransferase [Ichthyenterobacterium magnum]RKE94727.1 peptidoglycan/LPS O-acetylase OafA/YrhL [Ichthyenterobacterium magnum]
MDTIRRFYVLDAFRGLAALLVFLYHMPKLSSLTANAFIKGSGVFVDLFFVLSGFVIYHNYKNKLYDFSTSKSFITKRIKRLIPLHVYTLLILLILEFIKYLTSDYITYSIVPFKYNTMTSFWPQLFLLNSTPFFSGFNWNGQNWSISAELITYFLFILTSLLWLKKKKVTFFISFLIICFGYLFFVLKYNTYKVSVDFKFSFIRGFIGFYFGIIVYILRNYFLVLLNRISKIIGNVLEVLVLILVLYVVCNMGYYKDYFFIVHIVFGLLLFVFSMEKGIVSQLLRLQLFQKLGQWSYSIYLNHTLMIILYNMIIIKAIGVSKEYIIFSEILLIAMVCLYSYFTYEYIEKRFYKKLKK